MNKKRLILIVLAVLFALVLAADLALQPASPASTQPPRDFAADSGDLARLLELLRQLRSKGMTAQVGEIRFEESGIVLR